ncbi:hypothetical protein ACRAWG_12670 [Methylobacterium sp. P31]
MTPHDLPAFGGAFTGAQAALKQAGIDVGDEICAQVTLSVILGFVLQGGLDPETIAYLRKTIVIHDPQVRN